MCTNVVMYDILTDGLCKKGDIEKAMDFLHDMEFRFSRVSYLVEWGIHRLAQILKTPVHLQLVKKNCSAVIVDSECGTLEDTLRDMMSL